MADKIRVTVVFEYVPQMEHYAGCKDIHEAAKLDDEANNYRRYPDAYDVEEIVSVSYEGIPG